MPAPYGVVASGFEAKTLEEIKADLESALRAGISPSLNTASNTPIGQMVGVLSDAIRSVWELGQAVYSAASPDASDAALENIAAITGTIRKAATKSRVTATVNLDGGSYAAGALVAHVSGDPTARFANVDATGLVSAGNHDLVFEAQDTGPVQALAGGLTVIAEPLTGFNSITNAADAALGRDIESDTSLRLRLEREKSLAATGTAPALQAAISALPGIQYARVIENASPSVSAEGLPPYSFEVILYDGDPPAVDNELIAQTIFANKALGVRAHGVTTAPAITDDEEVSLQSFTRVSTLDLHTDWALTVDETYVGDAAFKSAIAEWATANLEIGEDVVKNQLIGAAMSVPGVVDVTALLIDQVDPPVLSANFAVGSAQIARLSTGNIDVTS